MFSITYLASSESIHSHKWISFFSKKGYKINWISLTDKNRPKENTINFISLKKPKNFFSLLFTIVKAYKLSKKLNSDFVHVHSVGNYGLIGRFFRAKFKILTPWGSDVLLNKKNKFKFFFIKNFLNNADLITTDGIHMRKEIIKFLKKTIPIKIINFGTDINKFKKINYKIKLKTSIKDDKHLKIISLRNFEKVYDNVTIIKAAEIIVKTYKKITFYLAGDGSEKAKLINMSKDLNLSDNICFLGKVNYDDLPNILNLVDIYVSASKSDAGIAASTAEAMACEMICIVTDVADNKKWINNNTGFLFEASNVSDLVSKINLAIKYKKNKQTKLQTNARKLIIQKNNHYEEMSKLQTIMTNLYNNDNK